MPHVRHDLPVAGVVERLDADDLRGERGIVLVDMLEEVELPRRRADDEDLLRSGQRGRDVVEEGLAVRDAALAFLFARHVLVRSLDLFDVEALRHDVKNLGFLVIDPDSGVA